MENMALFGKLFMGIGAVMILAAVVLIMVILCRSLARLGSRGRRLYSFRFYAVDWKVSMPVDEAAAAEGLEGRATPLCPACGEDLTVNGLTRAANVPPIYFRPFSWHCSACETFTDFPEGFRSGARDDNADILESVLMHLRVALADSRVRRSSDRLTLKEQG